MFKSIQWKLVLMFVLLIISVMIMVGTFLLSNITDFYHKDFIRQMENIFTEDFIDQINNMPKGSTDEERLNFLLQLKQRLNSHMGMMGIDTYRNYYLLDKLGEVVVIDDESISSKPEVKEILQNTPNIISAIRGKIGKEIKTRWLYMDYAIPLIIDGDIEYIIYINDSKNELSYMTGEMSRFILQGVFFGLIFSIILGFILSNTITTPIATLTQKAEKMATGDFEQKIEVKSQDEIGKLTNTFNHMALELRKTLEEISKEKNKVETIFLHMTDGVIAFDFDGNVIHSNPVAKRLLEIDDTRNMHFDDLFTELGVNVSLGKLIYLDNDKTTEVQIDINNFHVRAYFEVFKDEKDRIGGVVVVLQDATEQQKLDLARREFVANVSHELRTPLTSIKSYAETLLEGGFEEKQMSHSFLTVINEEADRMTRLVKDLLLLSNLDYKQNKLEKKYFSIMDLTEQVIGKLALEARNRGHSLDLNASSSTPNFYGDKDKIEQVLKNILSNAIKYTPDGGYIVTDLGYRNNNIIIKIKDNGIGIPKEDITRIFERFYRVDKARSRELGGTGLGLAIAKEIIVGHEGEIDIKSKQDKGTEVIIKLPVVEEKKM